MTTKSNYAIVTALKEADAKRKHFALFTRNFSRALSKFQVITRNSDWLVVLFVPVVIGRSNWSDILGFHTRDETAMLVCKIMAKCRSSFA